MSTTITTDLFCDICADWIHGTTHPSKSRARSVRQMAARMGWTRKCRDNKLLDLCPECSKE